MTNIDKIIEEIGESLSHALLDGQNQIHNLKDGDDSPEEITDRMHASFNYHTGNIKNALKNFEKQVQEETTKKIVVSLPELGSNYKTCVTCVENEEKIQKWTSNQLPK